MNEDRKERLKKLRADRAVAETIVVPIGKEFLEGITESVESIKDTFDKGIDINDIDSLIEQLGQIKYLKEDIDNLRKAFESLHIPEIPESIKVDGLSNFIKQIQRIDYKQVDLSPLKDINTTLKALAQKIDLVKAKQGQDESDFIPTRRVVKIGNKLFFDDNPTSTGSGGGGIDTALTRNSGTSIAVTNPDGTPIGGGSGGGGASTVADGADVNAGSTTDAAVDTDTTGTMSGKLRGLVKLFVNFLSRLPASLGQKARASSLAVTLSTEDITAITPPAAIAGFATASNQTDKSQFTKLTDGTDTALVTAAGEQNVLESNSSAIKTGIEIMDDWDNGASDGASVSGDVLHDAVDAGEPVKIGGKAFTATPTPVANADRTDAWFDEYGRQVVSDRDVETGLTIGSTGLRDRLVAQRYTVLADSLADGLATFWTSTTSNGGTTTSSGGEGLVQTSANATGSAQLSSTSIAYFPGQVGWLNSAVRFNDTGSAGNTRRLGVFTVSGTTPQEGFYYELSGTTLNAVVVKGGTPTAVASTSWSRVAEAPFTLDTNYHSFEIRYTANTVWFYVDNILRHRVSGTTAAITTTLNFAITIQSINASGASNRLIAVRNIGVGRFGMPGQPVNETGLSAVSSLAVSGGTPHDSVDSGNPIKAGGQARTTNPTAVADADRANFITDKLGKQVVVGSIRDLKVVQQTTITSSTAETTVLTAVASTFLDVYGVIVTNTSATVTKVTFKDDTAGTTRFVLEVPATETRGFMLPESGAIAQAVVNKPWTATCGTSVAAIEITMLAVKNV